MISSSEIYWQNLVWTFLGTWGAWRASCWGIERTVLPGILQTLGTGWLWEIWVIWERAW